MYYLRTQAARDAIKFTVKKTGQNPIENKEEGDNQAEDVEVVNASLVDMKKEETERTKYGGFTQKEMLGKMSSVDDDDPSMCVSCGS